MKKTLFLLTCALTITSAHAKTKIFSDMPRILGLNELTPDKIDEFVHAKDSDVVLECREGTEIPLRYFVTNGIFSLHLDPNLTVKVEKTIYLRVVGKKCYASYDLVNWDKASHVLDNNNVNVNVKVNPSKDKAGYTIETTISPREGEEEQE